MKHKVFVSYHHENDQLKADYLRDVYGKDNAIFSDKSLEEALPSSWSNEEILSEIRTKHLADSTVTIVLIGSESAGRKWIDWEINASLRPYGSRTRNGLLGIYLPTTTIVPARLQDNIDSGYAVTMKWENISWQLESKIQDAFDNRETQKFDNSRPLRVRNS